MQALGGGVIYSELKQEEQDEDDDEDDEEDDEKPWMSRAPLTEPRFLKPPRTSNTDCTTVFNSASARVWPSPPNGCFQDVGGQRERSLCSVLEGAHHLYTSSEEERLRPVPLCLGFPRYIVGLRRVGGDSAGLTHVRQMMTR
ncbi:hypothetical protein H6P81_020199 [Aristolochia fimbriata]|uniref:Uncharacterized protein n=1 Tax=Aristolochia fimbriata TaxID=158543 RepID=A0AAV7DVP2_ARIFI|nr:hypothetical protein H6P81_020199 [Aristolochia fimbriata]